MKEYVKLSLSENDGLTKLQQEVKDAITDIFKNNNIDTKTISTVPPHVTLAKDENVKKKFDEFKNKLVNYVTSKNDTSFYFGSWSLMAGKHKDKVYVKHN